MKKYFSFLFVSALIGLASCQKDPAESIDQPVTDPINTVTVSWPLTAVENSQAFNAGTAVGPVDYMEENSGLDVSINNPGYLWGHNDSGDLPYMYLINKRTGAFAAKFIVKGIESGDFEDIAVGPGPVAGKNYIYFGDIGDNFKFRPYVNVYRFEEPVLPSTLPANGIVSLSITYDHLKFTYPGGARDAESLLIDPLNKNIAIVSKLAAEASMYIATYPQSTSATTQLKLAVNLPFGKAVAGDVSADGKEVMIKTYDNIYYWKNDNQSSLQNVVLKAPFKVLYTAEQQGEAVCIDTDGFYTLSEKANNITPQLFFYKRK